MSTLPRPRATRTRSGDKEIKEITKKKKKNTFVISFHHFCRIFLYSFICSAITEMVVDFNSRIPTYLAKIFLGNELSISCQKLWQYNSLLILIIRVCLTKSHSIFSAFSRSQAKEATEAKEAKDAMI